MEHGWKVPAQENLPFNTINPPANTYQHSPSAPSNPQNEVGYPPNFQHYISPAQQTPVDAPIHHQSPGYPSPTQVNKQIAGLNCPPGLEYLTQLDQVFIKQKVEKLEAIAGIIGFSIEMQNKYKVKDRLGNEMYSAKEDTDCCTRNCCGASRPFDMVIKDNQEREVIHLNRPLRCQSCFFPCFLQTLEVSSPPGTVIGTVEQEWSIIKPRFRICDQSGNVVLKIIGPVCTYSICGNVEFKVTSPDEETEVGRISKEWSGLLKEAFTDADNFGISFPVDLDVRCKATLMGAALLIDYMFFEKTGNEEQDGFGML